MVKEIIAGLYEIASKLNWPKPTFEDKTVVTQERKANPLFTFNLNVQGFVTTGQGASKKSAKRAAARAFFAAAPTVLRVQIDSALLSYPHLKKKVGIRDNFTEQAFQTVDSWDQLSSDASSDSDIPYTPSIKIINLSSANIKPPTPEPEENSDPEQESSLENLMAAIRKVKIRLEEVREMVRNQSTESTSPS